MCGGKEVGRTVILGLGGRFGESRLGRLLGFRGFAGWRGWSGRDGDGRRVVAWFWPCLMDRYGWR